MGLILPYLSNLRSTLMVASGLFLYTLICWLALNQGLLLADGEFIPIVFGVWAVGLIFVPLAMLVDFSRRYKTLKSTVKRLQQLALRDDLTGVNNRRHLMDYLHRQKAAVDRGGPTFSICYADLDHFKQTNDLYGHLAGDEVLQAFAELAATTVRDIDFVARIGGEEFVLVLSGASARDAYPVAERLRLAMLKKVVRPGDPAYRVSVSLGIAQYCNEENVDELLHRADIALYQAKKYRNRTEMAPSIRMVRHAGKVLA